MKKIIAIVAVIATITACFCVGASAYEIGETIKEGTIIEFAEPMTFSNSSGYLITAQFESNGNTYSALQKDGYSLKYKVSTGDNLNTAITAYNGSNDTWTQGYNKIKFKEDYKIVSENIANLFSTKNVVKITPPILQKTLDNTKATFSTTLTVSTAIIVWLMANQIALVGLYMYILIALIATGKRFIKGA